MPITIEHPQQLSLFNIPVSTQIEPSLEICHPHPQPKPILNLKLADKLDKLASTMQKTIDSKLHPAIANQNITARRSRIAASMREEGEKLQTIQQWLLGLARSHRQGICPKQFLQISSRKQLEDFALLNAWMQNHPKYLEDCYAYQYSIVDRLSLFGIKSKDDAIAAVKLLESLCSEHPTPTPDRSVETAKELRRKAIYTKVPDFFPTPKEVIDRMLEIVKIEPSYRVLDPSAGAGDICLAIRELGATLIDCFEVNSDLTQALTLLGFLPLGRDFLEAEPQPIYDRIVMNPPFSKDVYIDHVRAAYEWLAPGGELIAVLPNGYRDSRIAKRRGFTDWLDDLGVECYDNPSDAFTKSDRSCGVSTHLIHLQR